MPNTQSIDGRPLGNNVDHIQNHISDSFLSKEEANHQDVSNILNNIRMSNLNNVIKEQVNVNSLSEKLDPLKLIIPTNIDIEESNDIPCKQLNHT